MFGFMLDTLFMESLDADLERLQRINELVATGPGAMSLPGMRRIDTLVMHPRSDLSATAAAHVGEMPRSVRALLRTMGAPADSGGQLTSYLLFEAAYTRRLIQMGFDEAQSRRDEICGFLGIGGDQGAVSGES